MAELAGGHVAVGRHEINGRGEEGVLAADGKNSSALGQRFRLLPPLASCNSREKIACAGPKKKEETDFLICFRKESRTEMNLQVKSTRL